MSKTTYFYAVSDADETPSYKLTSVFDEDDLDYLAEEAAESYFDNHDGWESSWPLTFSIYKDDKLLGIREVYCESVPSFRAVRP